MLDAQTIATVKATIPLLVETGPKLTAHFYDRMFTHNPELKEIFNMSNQRNGDQREALFNAIAAYASNIENLAALLPADVQVGTDRYDAALCALMALQYAAGGAVASLPDLVSAPSDFPLDEGWVYHFARP